MSSEQDRGPGSRTREELVCPESGILTRLGRGVQNLAHGLGEIACQKQGDGSLWMTPVRLEEEEERTKKLACELGYVDDGEIDVVALRRDWEKICPKRP